MSVIFMHNTQSNRVLKKPKVFSCYVCSNTFTQMSNLRKHLRNIHRIQMNLRRKGTDYTCSYCSLTFSRKTNLKRHQVGIHQIDENKLEYSVRFLCNTCTAAFNDQASLRTHRKNRHGDDDEKIDNPYECGECGELFQKKGLLKHHMRCRHLSETDNYQFLKNILPKMTNSLNVIWYSVLNESQEHFKAKFTMSIKNRAEIEKWINEFQSKNKITLRKRSVHRTMKSNVIYHVKYGCHHNTKPKAGTRHVSAKHTKCEASIALKLFALSADVRNYAEVRLIHTHNHVLDGLEVLKFREPTEEVKKKFRNMFMSGMTPSQALLQHKKDLEQQYGDDYSVIIGDRGICPNKSWVYNYRGICFKRRDKQIIDVCESSENEICVIEEPNTIFQISDEEKSIDVNTDSFSTDANHSDSSSDNEAEDTTSYPFRQNYNVSNENNRNASSTNIVHIPYTADISNVKVNNSKIVFTTVPKLRKVNDFPLFRGKLSQSSEMNKKSSSKVILTNSELIKRETIEDISLDCISESFSISSDLNAEIIVLNKPLDNLNSTVLPIEENFGNSSSDSEKSILCSDVEILDSNSQLETETVILNASYSPDDSSPKTENSELEHVLLEFDHMNEIIKEKARSNPNLIEGMQQMVYNFYHNLQDSEILNSALFSFGKQ
ncbi:uncharacterized protein LOC135840058 [Planococcus citri]|uniref:uncharacterized protein LOC135840058 n=1 Tax=Planococcus citri TaxID=170843 RepID=UPI0031F9572A